MTKSVLITGVSSGIGLAQARAFLQLGYHVFGVDKSQNPLLDGDFHFLQADVTGDLTAVLNWCSDVDVLCLTAGVLDDFQSHLDTDESLFMQVFDTNFLSVTRLVRPYLAKMVQKRSGVIITMCSIASQLAGGGGSAYTASKHALAGFTKQLALDYAKEGVQVFGIAPGAVKTGMTKADFEPGGMAEWVASETPIGRWLDADEVAEVTLFLASGRMSAMQGQIITIDGGWSLK